eukprot:3902446-Prymnesium_polylepis.1
MISAVHSKRVLYRYIGIPMQETAARPDVSFEVEERPCVGARAPLRSGNPYPACLPDSAGRVAGSPRTWK